MSKSIHRPEYAVLTELLRDARLRAGKHQADVAAALDRSQSFVSDVELGARRLDLLELRDLCQILGVDFLDFVRVLDQAIRALPAPRRGGAKRKSQSRRNG